MTDREREELLGRWIKPSGDDEAEQQERALRMVTDAINASALKSVSKRIYAKGSYANQTNVRRDSDVDIAVDCHECIYYDSYDNVTPKVSKPAYQGPWMGLVWRNAVTEALAAKFGSDLDASGSTALYLPEVPGSRPSIDIVPGYHYRKYRNADGSSYYDGSKVFTSKGPDLINWPQQQFENNNIKDGKAGGRYKEFVRALKSAENRLVEQGEIENKPSFMMECLVYNVENTTLYRGSLSSAFRATLQELWAGLNDSTVVNDWLEPSHLKYAFRGNKKWSIDDAKQVVQGAWNLLEYS